MRAYNFGSSAHNLTKFYQGMWLIAGMITWTLSLQGVPPTKIWEGENVLNLARFVTTFEFDRKYLRNGTTYRKSEKYFINYISSPIGRKKFGELWSTNQKSYRRACRPTQLDFFRGTIFRRLVGAGHSNFYTPYNSLKCISSRTWGAGRPHVGLCPIFLVFTDSRTPQQNDKIV